MAAARQTGGGNMKALLSVPGARLAFILKDSPSFASTVNAGLTAAGVTTNSSAYYQFFALAQQFGGGAFQLQV